MEVYLRLGRALTLSAAGLALRTLFELQNIRLDPDIGQEAGAAEVRDFTAIARDGKRRFDGVEFQYDP
jgi:hypothetical protein